MKSHRPNVILVGQAGAGKTTVANFLVNNFGYKKYALATKIKDLVHDCFGEFDHKPRELYQRVGDMMRSIDKNAWVNALARQIERDRQNGILTGPYVIEDIRYVNEFNKFNSDAISIAIITNYDERVKRLLRRDGKVDYDTLWHSSELEVSKIVDMCDVILFNEEGIDSLYEYIESIINEGLM